MPQITRKICFLLYSCFVAYNITSQFEKTEMGYFDFVQVTPLEGRSCEQALFILNSDV